MATLGEYGSLLQLGFGIGIGLSVFRAPMDLMSKAFERELNAEIDVFDDIQTIPAREKKTRLSNIKFDFSETSRALNIFHLPFMIASIAGAVVNWALLAKASSEAGYELAGWQEWAVFLLAGPFFLFIAIVLAGFTYRKLRPLRKDLNAIRAE
jgi:hypothetical protein